MSSVRTLIVDDEPLARRRIRRLLERSRPAAILEECENGAQAVHALESRQPDVVFLDVRMPDMDGFEVLERAGLERAPVVVFVTAYDDYALRAFDVHAVDYLLKPFDDERLYRAFDRAAAQCQRGEAEQLRRQLRALLAEGAMPADSGDPGDAGETKLRDPERIVVRTGGRTSFVSQEELDWIEADGSYVRLHAQGEVHLLRATMSELEQRLEAQRFLRVHRSRIVQMARVERVLHGARGALTLVLPGDVRVRVSQRYSAAVRERLDL